MLDKVKIYLKELKLSEREKKEIIVFLEKEYDNNRLALNDSFGVSSKKCPTCGK